MKRAVFLFENEILFILKNTIFPYKCVIDFNTINKQSWGAWWTGVLEGSLLVRKYSPSSSEIITTWLYECKLQDSKYWYLNIDRTVAKWFYPFFLSEWRGFRSWHIFRSNEPRTWSRKRISRRAATIRRRASNELFFFSFFLKRLR